MSGKTFDCVVCYGDGAETGKVISKCNHDICLPCYTNVIVHTGTTACCPICRSKYMANDSVVPVSEPTYTTIVPPGLHGGARVRYLEGIAMRR